MKRVIVYIDGFNLYHAIDALKKPHLKWLDLASLGTSLLRDGEELSAVKYFSAFATWLPDAYARHRVYVDALRATDVTVCMSKFKKKPQICHSCKTRWTSHEEKETDVQIAVSIVADALQGQVDRIILISADTDLTPAVKLVAEIVPECEVFVATPPGRLNICKALAPKLELTAGRLEKCRFPEMIQRVGSKAINCPVVYNLPIALARPPQNQP
jgi:uncharacterized LabA/DUF88 family protein